MDCTDWTLQEAATMLARRELTAAEYAERLLRRGDEHGYLNAFISQPGSAVLEAAMDADARMRRGEEPGPLHGVPLAVKDNIDTAGLPTTGGTPALRGHRPRRDAAVVRRLRRAGAIVLGKTNLHELAYGVTSDNGFFGPVRNPYDSTRIAGGSSGGTAAAVSARLAAAGLGTDTGGSVRIPAALCGVAGLRPSMGRYDQCGLLAISPTRDTAGPIARAVGDLALLDRILADQPASMAAPLPSPLRIGIPRFPFYRLLDRATARVVEDRLMQLQASGAKLVEADLPRRVEELTALAGFPIVFHETPVALRRYLNASDCPVTLEDLVDEVASPDVKDLLEFLLGEGAVGPAAYGTALRVYRPELQQHLSDYFTEHDVAAIAFPTTPITACSLGHTTMVSVNDERMSAFAAYIRNTNLASVIGWAGLSVPAGLDEQGLPVGLELDGPPGSEPVLLAIGQHCEQLWGRLPAPGERTT
ncbi:indoleacetamide hydrolase [Streptomyces sp. NPDC051909]|uniref:indoleacetamide hydrolase n=1 Tax=Streptomyces sp. NPDC051909 TaxID=3154944 RepID=UPI003445632A